MHNRYSGARLWMLLRIVKRVRVSSPQANYCNTAFVPSCRPVQDPILQWNLVDPSPMTTQSLGDLERIPCNALDPHLPAPPWLWQ